MDRRQILKGIATSSVLGVTAGTAAGSRRSLKRIDSAEAVHVVRGGEIVRTVAEPTPADVKRLSGQLGEDEQLVDTEGDCTAYCCGDCTCYPCLCNCDCKTCWDGSRICQSSDCPPKDCQPGEPCP